jgi:hypothetical protein
VHVSFPFGWAYRKTRWLVWFFNSGVEVEGRAWFCEYAHGIAGLPGLVSGEFPRVPQHIDLELRFWNRRGGRVTVIEPAEIRILSRTVNLKADGALPFDPVTLEEGDAPVSRYFALVPSNDPASRVEASTGEVLRLVFRPSRGSERWGRPEWEGWIAVRQPSDRVV